jgi:hypothetical protein
MSPLPFYIPVVFMLTTFITIYIFHRASGKSTSLLVTVAAWLIIQSVVALTGFFTVTNTLPPRFLMVIALPVLGMIFLFSNTKGRQFLEGIDTGTLTLLHSVRMPVEVVLFWLFLNKAVPQLMTFEGRNFDLISGVTAPLVYYFGYVKRKLGNKTLLAWNLICLLILLFTVSNAILSAPTPLQKFGFDQPTIAVFYFPFIWLPGLVVPIVIFSHLVTIRFLLKEIRNRNTSPLSLTVKHVA